jgi:hypothetical protein
MDRSLTIERARELFRNGEKIGTEDYGIIDVLTLDMGKRRDGLNYISEDGQLLPRLLEGLGRGWGWVRPLEMRDFKIIVGQDGQLVTQEISK